MEQKSYKWEIVLALTREEGHIRGLAKQLKTNHMTIARKMRELFQENITDYRQKGKNKVYALKKTTEARIAVYMSEQYKTAKTLRMYPRLRRIIDAIHADKRIMMGILFGSYAKGLANKESDIDLFIETQDRTVRDDLKQLDSKMSIKLGAYDPSNLLIQEIEKNHVIFKGVEHYYEQNAFFE